MQETEMITYPDSNCGIFVDDIDNGAISMQSIFESIHEALGDCCPMEDIPKFIVPSNIGFDTSVLVRRSR